MNRHRVLLPGEVIGFLAHHMSTLPPSNWPHKIIIHLHPRLLKALRDIEKRDEFAVQARPFEDEGGMRPWRRGA